MHELEALKIKNERLAAVVESMDRSARLLVQRDIELRRANAKLESLDTEKSEFVSIAAHQLRTPLTVVRFANQMLSDAISSNLNESQLAILKKSTQSIQRMFELIEELIVIDAIDYGELKLSYETVIVESLITEILDVFTEVSRQKKIQIVCAFGVDSKNIRADAKRLKDVISNLIDNAIKYSSVGGSVTISTAYTNSTALITVNDTGIGVNPDDVDRLFTKFSRFENAKRLDANGSGLGLYIGKKMVEKHNGTITFVPNIPSGSSFIITLPI
jgi:signal transduction histidine kinase